MKAISQKELKELFENTDFKISVSTSEDINLRHCYISLGDEMLCCLRGKISEEQIFDKVCFSGYNKITRETKYDTRDDCRYAFSQLPSQKMDKIFDIFGFSPLSEYDIEEYKQQKEEEQVLEEKLSTKPQYQRFYDNKVFAVSMREELVLDSTNHPEFIGTYGMGPCIGVAIISKKDGRVNRVGLTHIDALTELRSLEGFVYRSTKDADDVDIVMVSSGNEKEQARKILKQILFDLKLYGDVNIFSELKGSSSFAVNTLTGSIYKDIPMKAFVEDHALDTKEAMMLSIPGCLHRSPLYDTEKRQKAQSVLELAGTDEMTTDIYSTAWSLDPFKLKVKDKDADAPVTFDMQEIEEILKQMKSQKNKKRTRNILFQLKDMLSLKK